MFGIMIPLYMDGTGNWSSFAMFRVYSCEVSWEE